MADQAVKGKVAGSASNKGDPAYKTEVSGASPLKNRKALGAVQEADKHMSIEKRTPRKV